jgi:hypothetical protein
MFERFFKRPFRRTPKPQVERALQPVVEDLEGRQLMSVSPAGRRPTRSTSRSWSTANSS